MTTFSKLRELVTLTRNLEREAKKMRPGSQGRVDRQCEAEEYRLKAQWMVGRISDEEYWAGLREVADAKAYPVN